MHPDNEKKISTTKTIEIKPLGSEGKPIGYSIDEMYPAMIRDDLAEKAEFLAKRMMNISAVCDAKIAEKHEEEEWIWVDGYKGTKSDMTASQDFQYKLSEMYSMDEDVKIEVCKNGFHFCRDLKDVFEYYHIKKSNRFFKVRALVRKKDYEKYGTVVQKTGLFGRMEERIDKLVAKKIILERELTLDEIFFEDKYADWTEDEKKLAVAEGCRAVLVNRKARELVEVGYSEAFAKYISESDNMTKKALAVASQPGLSMDMKVFAIMYND